MAASQRPFDPYQAGAKVYRAYRASGRPGRAARAGGPPHRQPWLLDTANAVKSARNCPKLPEMPKFAQRKKFEIPPKIEILMFLKNKNLYV
jgi:hypothetical protein